MGEKEIQETNLLVHCDQKLIELLEKVRKGEITEKEFSGRESSIRRIIDNETLKRLGRKTMAKKQTLKKISIWVGIIALIGTVVFGLYKKGVLAVYKTNIELPEVQADVKTLKDGYAEHDKKIDVMDNRVGNLEKNVNAMDVRQEKRFDKLDKTLDRIEGKL